MAAINTRLRHIISLTPWVFSGRIFTPRPFSSMTSFLSTNSWVRRLETTTTRSMTEGKVPLVSLSSGYKMPIVGLGTWHIDGEEALRVSLEAAFDAGYRHIDAAFAYKNEKEVGKVLADLFKEGKIKREELFITAKLPSNGMRPEHVREFFEKSRSALQLDYVDLYLIHFPLAFKRSEKDDETLVIRNGDAVVDDVDFVETWKVIEKLVDEGLTKSIGLSNFNSKQIQRLYDAARIKPANLQVECHAYLPQYELLEFCKTLNIAMTAYASLGTPFLPVFVKETSGVDYEIPLLLKEEKLKPLSEKHKKSEAQILLKYLVQRGIIVIPKSRIPEEIKENIELFDFTLDEKDMELLRSMANGYRFFPMNSWPSYTNHPEYPYGIPF